MNLPRSLRPLRERDFALYWCGQVVSQCGTWIEITATTWLLYDLSRSPFVLGLGGAVRAVPIILLTLVGGTLADRFPRRTLLLAVQAVWIVSSLVIGALVATGAVEVWHLLAYNFVNATVMAFEAPARQSFWPGLVPRELMQSATALNSVIFRTSTFVGPALGGILIVTLGVAAPFFINAASYAAIVVALLLIRFPATVTRARASLRSDAMGGVRYVLASPILRTLVVADACLAIFGVNQALVTVFAREILDTGAAGLGLLLSALGAGAVSGIGVVLLVGDVHRKGRFMVAMSVVYICAFAAFGGSRDYLWAWIALFVAGLADSASSAMRNTIWQLATSDAFRGRVIALNILVNRGMHQTSQLQTGITASAFGPQGAVAVGVAALVVTIGAVVWRSPLFAHTDTELEPA